ncbi:DNA recombination protein RmuC [Klebsiella pneumoniae]|nr:DNA recombination protein RmuC [Klebsiella pneumoniae]
MRNHICLLGRKDYQQLPGLRSLDYVLTSLFPLSRRSWPSIASLELISEALQNNIMLVSPTTLLVALRTIANRRRDNQSRNAQKIAERAGRLFTTKMRLFVG